MKNNSPYKTIASGWIRENEKTKKEYISAKCDVTRTKHKLFVEDENGNVTEVINFIVTFNEKNEKYPKAPDVNFIFNPDKQNPNT